MSITSNEILAPSNFRKAELIALAWKRAETSELEINLFECYRRAVLKASWKLARKFKMEQDDFISPAFLGMMTALRKWDPSRELLFLTSAWWWMNRAMIRHGRENAFTMRRPSYIFDNNIAESKGLAVTVRDEFGVQLTGKKITLSDLLLPEDPGFAKILEDHSVAKLLSPLAAEDQLIVYQRVIEERTLKEIGAEYDLSQERIRQRFEAALAILRIENSTLDQVRCLS